MAKSVYIKIVVDIKENNVEGERSVVNYILKLYVEVSKADIMLSKI